MRNQTFYYVLMSLFTVLALPFMYSCGGSDDDGTEGDNGNKGGDKPSVSTEYVDLGLSVKWATCNLGTNKPWESGNYYAWGETKPKSEYTDSNYTYSDDHPAILPITADPASINLGRLWHTPTVSEFQELIDNCNCTETTMNGIKGLRFVGPNGNSIFLPACQGKYSYYTSKYQDLLKWAYDGGHYWTSNNIVRSFRNKYGENIYYNSPYCLNFMNYYSSDPKIISDGTFGAFGCNIRAVHL